MVRHGRLPGRRVEQQPKTTQVDMLTVSIGGSATQARPYEIATNPVSGEQYPSRAVTSCPHCGHGIEFEIRQDQALSGVLLTASCANCSAGVAEPQLPLEDPFRNPLIDGLITRGDIDPLYGDPMAIKTSEKDAASKINSRRKKACSKQAAQPASQQTTGGGAGDAQNNGDEQLFELSPEYTPEHWPEPTPESTPEQAPEQTPEPSAGPPGDDLIRILENQEP